MEPKTYCYERLIKSEDLNHHKTLFAGRCAEWFVEAGFIAAASVLPADHIVCLKIHGLSFTQPMKSGDIASFQSKIIHVGRTSLKVYVQLINQKIIEPIVKGFITFVHVNDDGQAVPHGLKLEILDSKDKLLNQIASNLE